MCFLSLLFSWVAVILLFSSLSKKTKTKTKTKWLERERERDAGKPSVSGISHSGEALCSPESEEPFCQQAQIICWFLSNSVDRLDRTNSIGNDLEKNQVASSRNTQVPDHGDAGGSNLLNENHYSRFIALEGCSNSAASQLLNDRWTAAIQSYNNSKDSSEKPVMYSGGTSVWTQFRLPHQIMSPAASASSSVTAGLPRRTSSPNAQC